MTDMVIVLILVALAVVPVGLFLLQRRIRRRRTIVDLSALQLQYAPGAPQIARQSMIDAQLPAARAVPTEVVGRRHQP